MKYAILILFAIGFTTAQGQVYQVDLQKSRLDWSGKAAFNAYSLSGQITPQSGSIVLQEGQLVSTAFNIDMTTITSELPRLTKHLKSSDFFEVDKFNAATFQSRELTFITNDSISIRGDLTIKGITKSHVFTSRVKKADSGQLVVAGDMQIDRTEFEIYFNSPNYFKNLKQEAIADEFTLSFELYFLLN